MTASRHHWGLSTVDTLQVAGSSPGYPESCVRVPGQVMNESGVPGGDPAQRRVLPAPDRLRVAAGRLRGPVPLREVADQRRHAGRRGDPGGHRSHPRGPVGPGAGREAQRPQARGQAGTRAVHPGDDVLLPEAGKGEPWSLPGDHRPCPGDRGRGRFLVIHPSRRDTSWSRWHNGPEPSFSRTGWLPVVWRTLPAVGTTATRRWG